jgi:hypothetical protein
MIVFVTVSGFDKKEASKKMDDQQFGALLKLN